MTLIRAIVRRDEAQARELLVSSPGLAREAVTTGATRQAATDFFFPEIAHYVYAGDTALHVAAAAYQLGIARELIRLHANVAAKNRRGAEPLHYAADGGPLLPTWNPTAQAEIIAFLIESGADPNALDKSGVAPLHRAIRQRCTGAVKGLLACGANVNLKNKSGSTPLLLAELTTGKGGSGSPEAKACQQEIIAILLAAGAGHSN